MPEVLEKLTAEELDERERQLLSSLEAPTKVPTDPNISRLGPSGLELREQELIRSLRKDGIDTDEPEIVLSAEEDFQRDQGIQKILSLPSMAGADPNDVIENYPIYETNPQINKIGFREALVRSKKLQLLPFVGSLFKTEEILRILKAAKRLSSPNGTMVDDLDRPHFIGFESVTGPVSYSKISVDNLREKDMKLVTDWLVRLNEEQERGFTIGGRIAQGIAELPGFMVEFLLTGPIFKVGSASAKTVATKILGRFAEKGVGKLAVKVAGAGFGSFTRTAVNVPRILAGTVENMTKGIQITDDGAVVFSDAEVNPFSALARSFADLYVENLTEIAGPSLKKGVVSVGTGIGKKFPMIPKFTQAVAEKWISNGAAKGLTRTFGGFLKASATKVGYDGILEEMGEEQLGRIIRGVTGLEDFETIIPKWEDILVEAGIFAIPGVTISLAQTKIFRKDLPKEPIERRLGLVGKELEVAPTVPIPAPEPTPKPITKPKAKIIPTKAESAKMTAEANRLAIEEVGKEPVGLSVSEAEGRAWNKKFTAAGVKHFNRLIREFQAKAEIAPVAENRYKGIDTSAKEVLLKGIFEQLDVVSDIEVRARYEELKESFTKEEKEEFKDITGILDKQIVRDLERKAKRKLAKPEAVTEGKVVTKEAAEAKYKKAGDIVDGRKVRTEVPNTTSIEATFGNDFTELSGIREVPMSEFGAPPDINKKTKALAEEIKRSGEISPLIIAIDKNGPYILEGANRFDAMKILDAKSIPAVVVTDDFSLRQQQITPEAQPPTEAKAEETKVVETTVETKTNAIKANAKEASVEATGTVDAIRRNVLRAEDAVGFWGTAGKKVQRDLREISARTAINVGNTSQNIRAILKGLNSKEKVIVAQLTDKAISKKGQPARLVERARQLTVELDLMQIEAQDVGLRKQELTGKAFPQVPNKKGKAFLEEAETKGAKSHRVFAWAQNKVTEYKESEGKKGFETVDSAIAALQNYRRTRLRGTEGYFEGKRTLELDLDMREWSPDKVLSGIIEGGWEAIEGARQWGVTEDGNFKDIRTSIERIRGEVGNDQANLLEDYIKAQYGQSRASITAKKWTRRARAFQFTTKLAPSMLTITRNMLDRYAKGMAHGTIGTNIRATLKFPPFLNVWMKTSQKIQDEMIRQGAVLGHGHLSEGFASGGAISQFLGRGFAASERGNQTYIALVKKLQLEVDIKRLHEMGGETGTVGKMYDRMLTIVGQSQLQTRKRVLTDLTNEQLAETMAQKEIDDDVMSEVLHRVVTDSAFPLTLASKRMWWGNRPFVQTMTQFKVWSADQMRFIYKDVLKYTVATGDPSRLARFILGTWLAGELYNIARDFLKGRDESLVSTLRDPDGRNVKDISRSIGNALVDGGVIGMLADLTYGITDWAFGPTVGSIESIARIAIAVKNDPATTVDGLKKFVLEDIPAAKQAQGVLDRIDRTFFDEKDENLTANYAKWRRRSFDFRRKKGELTAAERLTGKIILGRGQRVPGPRTLSLEMIARQVLVGDADDAADYIVGIIKDTKPEKLKDLRASFRQSAVNNSPLGNIAKKDISEFLGQFSKEGQAEIVALQNQWNKNYNEAVTLASKQLKEGNFLEDLKKELAAQK